MIFDENYTVPKMVKNSAEQFSEVTGQMKRIKNGQFEPVLYRELYQLGLDFGAEDPEVANLDIEIYRNWLALRVLPYFEAAASLQVRGDAGMTFLGFVVCVWEHPFRHRVVLQHPDVHLKHVGIPFP